MSLEGESKFPKKSEEHKKTTNLDKRISSILCELKIMNPETLLLEVDPSVHSVELIQQIQMYHALVNKEISDIVNYFFIVEKLRSRRKRSSK
jgi:hypothetical protein